MKNKITFENEHGIYSVEYGGDREVDHIGRVVNYLIIPVLRAAGYTDKVINEYVIGDEDQW